MEKWLEDAFDGYDGTLEDLVDYAIARAHLEGHSLIRTGGRMNDDDEDYSSIYLLCSCRGVNAAKRGDNKTKCPFKVRLSKSEFGEFKSIVTNINHNHPGPFVTVHEGGQVELKIAQRYLLQEE